MSMNYPNRDLAAGSVAGGTGTATWIAGATSARTGAGVYTLTLDQPTDSTQCSILVSRRGAAAAADGTFSVAHTSDSVKTVTYTEAGVAADADFDFHVIRAPF
jgi:hypothetical protein